MPHIAGAAHCLATQRPASRRPCTAPLCSRIAEPGNATAKRSVALPPLRIAPSQSVRVSAVASPSPARHRSRTACDCQCPRGASRRFASGCPRTASPSVAAPPQRCCRGRRCCAPQRRCGAPLGGRSATPVLRISTHSSTLPLQRRARLSQCKAARGNAEHCQSCVERSSCTALRLRAAPQHCCAVVPGQIPQGVSADCGSAEPKPRAAPHLRSLAVRRLA